MAARIGEEVNTVVITFKGLLARLCHLCASLAPAELLSLRSGTREATSLKKRLLERPCTSKQTVTLYSPALQNSKPKYEEADGIRIDSY